MDILLESTDPSLVFFEPDVYWIEWGGADPVEYLRRYAGRCPYVHLKDVAADGSFEPLEVQPDGGRRMDYATWLRGLR